MNNTIKINEQDLKRLVRESVEELKYKTYRNAYKKMRDSGQRDRATEFSNTFSKLYDDEPNGISFNLPTDTMKIDNHNLTNGGACVKFNPEGSVDIYGHSDGEVNGFWNDPSKVKHAFPRTHDRKSASKRAARVNFYYGDDRYTKSDFISECIDRVFGEFLK